MQLSTNIQSLSALRQPTKLGGGQGGQKLVFIYPLLVDAALNKYAAESNKLKIVELTAEQKQKWQKTMSPVYPQFYDVIGEDLIKKAIETK